MLKATQKSKKSLPITSPNSIPFTIWNGQQTVELHGDRAEGIAYCQVALVSNKDSHDEMLTHYVRYNDSYAKINGRWVIQKRIAHFMYSETRTIHK